MTRRIYIFVNGILNRPGDAHAWTDRAAAWVNANTNFKGEKFEYFAGILTRRLFQSAHAQDLAEEIAVFQDSELVLVGHSNGCDLILRALRILFFDLLSKFRWTPIKAIHLISGACEPDFQKNGLNDLLSTNLVGDVTIYIGGQDSHFAHPMWLARQSQRFIGWAGLGYGTLGATGPENLLDSIRGRVHLVGQPCYDHSTWFAPGHFEQLMASLTVPDPNLNPTPNLNRP